MATARSGAQVTFIESYAQPSGDGVSTENPTTSKQALLRPSLVIAGDAKALECVRTVHSPKSLATSPKSPKSPATSAKRRFSFSDAISEASHAANAVLEASHEGGSNWRRAWRRKLVERSIWKGKLDFVGTVAVLVFTIQTYGRFLCWHEDRSDIDRFAALSDPVLPYLDAHDFSTPLFFLVYGSILAGFVYGFDKPDLLIEFSQTNALVMWIRMVTLYLTPLEAPQDMIPLVDPIAHAHGTVFLRDLFFSGHTATTFLVFLVCRRAHWRWKALFFALALATALMVVLQKTHYTIDVFAAPFFAYTSHGLVQDMRRMCSGLYDEEEEAA